MRPAPTLHSARPIAPALVPVLVAGILGGEALSAQDVRPMDLHLPYTQFTLENGLTVVVHREPTLPIVAVNLWYHVGSANERPGRTGFAHLFEHIMFEGSKHVPEGEFDTLLESVGAASNGSTTTDRTNYVEEVPSSALELALWLEADRMGWLLDTMDRSKLDTQREVVKNERRQAYENQPYGLAWETLSAALYPPDHPYHWPVIGSMEDLEAATLDDVTAFFRTYYAPNNASLVVAGDVRVDAVRRLVERYFGEIPRGPEPPRVTAPDPTLAAPRVLVMEDDVQLPRLYMAWHSPPALTAGDAAMELLATLLANGRSSRLYRRLVYEAQVAQDVAAYQDEGRLGGGFHVIVTARPDIPLGRLEEVVREELARLAEEGPEAAELESARVRAEAEVVRSLDRLGGFDGRADRLNRYLFHTGDPGYIRRDLARYRNATPQGLAAEVRRWLVERHGVTLSVVPRGRPELAVAGSEAVR